jgi:RNA 2',3'-cyclic 3'-phosphodiesterase
MRAFLAFEIAPFVKTYLQEMIRGMAARVTGVRWVKDEGQHLTLKFFGETEESTVMRIQSSIGHLESLYHPFETSLREITAFPGKGRARVIVVTLEKGVDNVRAIFNDIENGLSTLGYEREKRELTPHITLGRRKIPAPLLDRDIPRLEQIGFILNRLVLFKSTLTPQGALYTPIWEINLKGETSRPGEKS